MNKNRKNLFILMFLITILLFINAKHFLKPVNNEIVIKENKLIAKLTGVSTVNNISNSLNSFYYTLDKPQFYIAETDWFRCDGVDCSTSTYENIGLLNLSEYNLVGGLNSYLASNESFFALNGDKIYNITPTGAVEASTSLTSGLRPVIYIDDDVEVTGSGKIDDPYRIVNKNDLIFANATLYGEPLDEFPDITDPYIPNGVTCTNGSIGHWDQEKNKIVLTTVNLPTTCTVDFKDGYTVTMTAENGSVTVPTSKVVGRTFKTSFNITPNTGYQLFEIKCNGKSKVSISGNTVTISDIKESQTCNAVYKKIFYDKLLADNPTRTTRTDFTSTFATENTGTLYTTTATEDGSTVYYFAGNPTNNWVKFGKNSNGNDLYWRIIRTNEDGSIRLLYSGTSPDTQSAYIKETLFNNDKYNRKYVGYMYGTDGSLENNRLNTNSSNIKTEIDNWYYSNMLTNYDKYISKTAIYCNDRTIAYSDRPYSYETFEFGSWKRVSGMNAWKNWYDRNASNNNPSHKCGVDETGTLYSTASNADKFSVSTTSGGNGLLTYPIALITVDEIKFIGGGAAGVLSSEDKPWYYNNSNSVSITGEKAWWTMTPSNYDSGKANLWHVAHATTGLFSADAASQTGYYLRPVISLKSCVSWLSGDGSPSSPYQIGVDEKCAIANN